MDRNNDTIDPRMLGLFQETIYRRLGIHIGPKREYLLAAKLNRILSIGIYPDLASLHKALRDGDETAWNQLIAHVTTTHTFFFREKAHFDMLADQILKRRLSRPTIFCAASSSGEEMYSIMITLIERGIEDFLIVASDLNRNVLLHLKKGVFHEDRLRACAPEILGRYFDKVDAESYRVKERLRKNFVIKKINLVDPFRFQERFDFIFCRNVMIYFDQETQVRVVDSLLENLRDDGVLFVGFSENLFSVTDKVVPVATSAYRKTLL